MDWSTGYWMDVPPLRKYASVAVWVPVGAFTPRPSAMFPEWLWGSSNHVLPIRLTSPNPSAVTAWRAESAYIRDCMPSTNGTRSEEHTSELQSPCNLVCRLLLEKKKKKRLK